MRGNICSNALNPPTPQVIYVAAHRLFFLNQKTMQLISQLHVFPGITMYSNNFKVTLGCYH